MNPKKALKIVTLGNTIMFVLLLFLLVIVANSIMILKSEWECTEYKEDQKASFDWAGNGKMKCVKYERLGTANSGASPQP